MSRPTRQTAGGRAYLDLQNRARREGRPTRELLILYVLERWLARLAASPAAGTFVLKGGMLLAALDARRPTAGADLLARHLANDERTVATRVREMQNCPTHPGGLPIPGVADSAPILTFPTINRDPGFRTAQS